MGVFVTAGSGGLSGPIGMTFGPDLNLYVTSFSSNQVLKYNGQTGAFLSVFANVGLNGPYELTFYPKTPR